MDLCLSGEKGRGWFASPRYVIYCLALSWSPECCVTGFCRFADHGSTSYTRLFFNYPRYLTYPGGSTFSVMGGEYTELQDLQLFGHAVKCPKGRFTRYDFCLRLSHVIFVARAARVIEKSYTISTISNCLSARLS